VYHRGSAISQGVTINPRKVSPSACSARFSQSPLFGTPHNAGKSRRRKSSRGFLTGKAVQWHIAEKVTAPGQSATVWAG
jgi:hypothetical protein